MGDLKYFFIVATKIVVAIIIEKSRGVINNRVYRLLLKTVGMILILFSVLFLIEGLKYFKLIF